MVWGLLYTEYKTWRHSWQKSNLRTVLSNSQQYQSEEYLNRNSYMCSHLLQALLHCANRYCWKMNSLRQTLFAPVFLTYNEHITRSVPVSGWPMIFHWMLAICTSAQSNYAFFLETSYTRNSRIIRLISLKCTGLWISNTGIDSDSKAKHKSGGWCFHGQGTNVFLELVGWRLVSFDVNWGQGYVFRQVLWFQTKISIP